MEEKELQQAEQAVKTLADVIGITEKQVVSILREGMEAEAKNKLSKIQEDLLSELENNFWGFQKMKIEKRILRGRLKGYTIRKSKFGWYALYSDNGVSQTCGKHTLHEIKKIIKDKTNN